MWAAIKSDFKEFVTETAEETKSVVATNKLATTTTTTTSSKPPSNDDTNDRSWAVLGATVSNLTAKASHVASNIDVRGIGGMMGGVAAVTAPLVAEDKSASALLAEDEEEELGWDDDDDDDDLDIEDLPMDSADDPAAEVVGAVDAENKSTVRDATAAEQQAPEQEPHVTTKNTNEILSMLRKKLSQVETERNELQAQHRHQTAELVELRSKMDELQLVGTGGEERREGTTAATTVAITADDAHVDPSHGDDGVVKALEEEIASLKSQLEASSHEPPAVDTTNDKENEQLLLQYQTQISQLQSQLESERQTSEASEAHHSRIADESVRLIESQKRELVEARTKSQALQSRLEEIESMYHSALREVEEKNDCIAKLQEEKRTLEKDMEDQATNFALTLEEEVSRTKLEARTTSGGVDAATATDELAPEMNTVEKSETTDAADREEEGEISSGEKINVDDSFVTAGEMLSPNNLKSALAGDEEEEDDWGDEW